MIAGAILLLTPLVLDRLQRVSVATTAKVTGGRDTPEIVVVADDTGNRTWFPYLPGAVDAMAEQADDWHLRAKLLSHMARQAIWCGDPDSGLTHTELALVRADRLTGTERAMLHTARARALGKLGRTQDTLIAVGLADEAFIDSQPTEDPPWMAYYDHAQHQGDTGHALFDLTIHAVPKIETAPRLAEAVRGHSDAYARSRAISGTKLAALIMATGDPHEASTIGQRAIDDAGRLRSRRAADGLRELRRFAGTHAALPEVSELRERITQLVGPT